MAARYRVIDHDTPLLMPPSLRDWLPPDHLVHVIMDAVEELDLSRARVNQRGSGDAQYPPGMLQRRVERKAKLAAARAELEVRALARVEHGRDEDERKMA